MAGERLPSLRNETFTAGQSLHVHPGEFPYNLKNSREIYSFAQKPTEDNQDSFLVQRVDRNPLLSMGEQKEQAEIGEFLSFAIDLARELGSNTAAMRREAKVLSQDYDTGLVTTLDTDNTALIQERITKRFPTYALATEELGKIEGSGSREALQALYRVVADEVDGTTNCAAGIGYEISDSPDYSTAIGLQRLQPDGTYENVAGVVYAAEHGANGVLYYASKGNGAFMEKDGKIRCLDVRNSHERSKDRFAMSFNVNIDPYQEAFIKIGMKELEKPNDERQNLITKFKPRQRECSAIELGGYLAQGVDSAFLHTKTKEHDVVAALVIAEEAGAEVSWINADTLLVTNGLIHEEVKSIVEASIPKAA